MIAEIKGKYFTWTLKSHVNKYPTLHTVKVNNGPTIRLRHNSIEAESFFDDLHDSSDVDDFIDEHCPGYWDSSKIMPQFKTEQLCKQFMRLCEKSYDPLFIM